MRLAELTKIRSGYTARGKLEPVPMGGRPALQLRDVVAKGDALTPDSQKYDLGKLADRFLVHGGEVVFRSRGELNIAAAIKDPLPEPAAVIVPLVIMRPDRAKLLPEYLAWAINQPEAQRTLDAEAQGTSIRMIPMAALENLEIPVPDLPKQKRIIELDALARQEGQLLRQLATLKEAFITAILGEAAKTVDHKEIA